MSGTCGDRQDYRKWLKEQGIDTKGMRPMGSAEGTMDSKMDVAG